MKNAFRPRLQPGATSNQFPYPLMESTAFAISINVPGLIWIGTIFNQGLEWKLNQSLLIGTKCPYDDWNGNGFLSCSNFWPWVDILSMFLWSFMPLVVCTSPSITDISLTTLFTQDYREKLPESTFALLCKWYNIIRLDKMENVANLISIFPLMSFVLFYGIQPRSVDLQCRHDYTVPNETHKVLHEILFPSIDGKLLSFGALIQLRRFMEHLRHSKVTYSVVSGTSAS